jgi:anti-anti-sigma factor
MEGIQISITRAETNPDISIVKINGYIDTTTSSELERVIQNLLREQRYKIIIDLSGVDYISSAGWGIFISEIKNLRGHRGDLKLANMSENVTEVYELLEFSTILNSTSSVAEALRLFAAGATAVPPESPAALAAKKTEPGPAAPKSAIPAVTFKPAAPAPGTPAAVRPPVPGAPKAPTQSPAVAPAAFSAAKPAVPGVSPAAKPSAPAVPAAPKPSAPVMPAAPKPSAPAMSAAPKPPAPAGPVPARPAASTPGPAAAPVVGQEGTPSAGGSQAEMALIDRVRGVVRIHPDWGAWKIKGELNRRRGLLAKVSWGEVRAELKFNGLRKKADRFKFAQGK